MTDEELDLARVREAVRICIDVNPVQDKLFLRRVALETARLARTGWVLVDPDLIEARKMVADNCEIPASRDFYISGKGDDVQQVKYAFAGIKRGRELAKCAD